MEDPTSTVQGFPGTGNGRAIAAPGIEPPKPPFPLYEWYQLESGRRSVEDLPEEKRVALDNYFREYEEYEEAAADATGLVDLSARWDEDTQVEMLTSRLVINEFHDYFGPSGDGKTWIALDDARDVIRKGLNVLWVDQEMGWKRMKERLQTLGFTREEVGDHFTYLQYPTFMDGSKESRAIWSAIVAERGCDLTVFDSLTPCLGMADVNENHGTEVARWQQAYITPVLRAGGSVLVLDHTGWSESGRPVGSRQKVARTRLEYGVRRHSRFDRETIGEVSLIVTKNTAAAPVAAQGEPRRHRIGGDGEGGFVFEPAGIDPAAKAARAERKLRLDREIERAISAADEDLSQNQVVGLVVGKGIAGKAAIVDALQRLSANELSPVKVKPGPRNSLLYRIDQDAN